jgi:probable selenium-dependent hydroxylase accessory protein YqeC
MELADCLEIQRGLTALIGGGGKTSLLYFLAEELRERGTVICCTTTKIWPPEHLPLYSGDSLPEIRAALKAHRVICLGTPNEQGKLIAPATPMAALIGLADYVLVEADGAAGRGAKAHAAHEPVLPPERQQTILVLGASVFGQPIHAAAHRPELYARLAGVAEETLLTPEIAARVIQRENLQDRVFINQVETEDREAAARELAEKLSCPTVIGSLQEKQWRKAP